MSRNRGQLEPEPEPSVTNAHIEHARGRLLLLIVSANQRGDRMSAVSLRRVRHRVSVRKLDRRKATDAGGEAIRPHLPPWVDQFEQAGAGRSPRSFGLGA